MTDKNDTDTARRWATATTQERIEILQLAELEGRQAALAGLPHNENYYLMNESEGELHTAWAAGHILGSRQRMGM